MSKPNKHLSADPIRRLLAAWDAWSATRNEDSGLYEETSRRALDAAVEALRTQLDATTTDSPAAALRSAIERALGPDPHSGGAPHPDTVDALTGGLLARIGMTNARPVKYAFEPWRAQSDLYHAEHALGHIERAKDAIEFGGRVCSWLSDLGQPEAVHAGLRIDFLLWVRGKAVGNCST